MAGILAHSDMFNGPNGAAMKQVLQGFCNPGIIISDVGFVRRQDKAPGTKGWAVLIIGYAKASSAVVTQQGDPRKRGPEHDRMYEMDRKEIRIPVDGERLDTDLIIAKLAIVRD